MEWFDKEIELQLDQAVTSVKPVFEMFIAEHGLEHANLTCWVPHEVGALVQLGWEDGLVEDFKEFLADTAPPGEWTAHDEPGTPFRENFYEHIRTKLVGNVSMTLLVKNSELYMGEYQDLYYYSPVLEDIPDQRIFCRVLKLGQ